MGHRLAAFAVALSTALAAGDALAQSDPDPPPPSVGLPGWQRSGPAGVPPPPPQTTYNNPVLMGVGILMLVGGAATTVSGSVLFGLAAATGVDLDPNRRTVHGPDIAALIIGGTLMVASVPMIIIGAYRVPAQPPPQARTLVPEIAVGPRAVVLGWRF